MNTVLYRIYLKGLTLFVLVVLAFLKSFAQETREELVWKSGERPKWVDAPPPETPHAIYFVGISKDSVNEQDARGGALYNAISQAAKYCGTAIEELMLILVSEDSSKVISTDTKVLSKQLTEALISKCKDRSWHIEQWKRVHKNHVVFFWRAYGLFELPRSEVERVAESREKKVFQICDQLERAYRLLTKGLSNQDFRDLERYFLTGKQLLHNQSQFIVGKLRDYCPNIAALYEDSTWLLAEIKKLLVSVYIDAGTTQLADETGRLPESIRVKVTSGSGNDRIPVIGLPLRCEILEHIDGEIEESSTTNEQGEAYFRSSGGQLTAAAGKMRISVDKSALIKNFIAIGLKVFFQGYEKKVDIVFVEPRRDEPPLVHVNGGRITVNGGEKEVDHFLISKSEVTNEQYARFLQAIGKGSDVTYQKFFNPMIRNYPATELTAQEADEYCKWVNCRLPTLEEWRLAVRSISPIDLMKVNCLGKKEPPVLVPANDSAYSFAGLYHLIGNVWEICRSTVSMAGEKNASYFIAGGSYLTPAGEIQTLPMYPWDGVEGRKDVGFRIVRSLWSVK